MLEWALIFFIIAIIAALFGLRGVAWLSADIGYVLVFVVVLIMLVALFSRVLASGWPP